MHNYINKIDDNIDYSLIFKKLFLYINSYYLCEIDDAKMFSRKYFLKNENKPEYRIYYINYLEKYLNGTSNEYDVLNKYNYWLEEHYYNYFIYLKFINKFLYEIPSKLKKSDFMEMNDAYKILYTKLCVIKNSFPMTTQYIELDCANGVEYSTTNELYTKSLVRVPTKVSSSVMF